jgi:hypothetical protein
MLAGLDSRKFAALIRQILADIAAHAIGAPIARVLTQPRSEAEIQPERLPARGKYLALDMAGGGRLPVSGKRWRA